jgi:hypothetical protein
MSKFKSAYPFLAAILLLLANPARSAEAPGPQPSHAHLLVTGAGLLMLAGGGAFAFYQNREADRDMAVYRSSAFTENTSAYRDRVEEHQRLTWAGLAGAALGGILIVVSF